MSGPIITNFLQVMTGANNGSYELLIEGQNFNAATHFSITDVANPHVVWNPSNQPGQVFANGGRAQISSTPSVPTGGPLPTSGELRLGAFVFGAITPTMFIFTKPFVYQGTL
jgi:hypothetical protein